MPDSRNATLVGEVADTRLGKDRLTNAVPSCAGIAQAFGRLCEARVECGKSLELEPISDIVHNPDQFTQGVPVLADVGPELLRGAYRQAASWMMPELFRTFPGIADELRTLEAAFTQDPDALDALLKVLVDEDTEGLARCSATLGVAERTLGFVGMEILRPCIQRAAALLGPLISETPWSKGHCPICGSQPDMAFLRPKDPEPSEFLVSKSGQLWLHCSLCAHQWRFLRSKCPNCGDTEPDGLMYFTPTERQGERIYACTKCNRYFTCLDLTEREAGPDVQPDMALAPLTMIHLDCLARGKGYIPLTELPWNQFSDAPGADISAG